MLFCFENATPGTHDSSGNFFDEAREMITDPHRGSLPWAAVAENTAN